jgi:hypothetical protein
MITKRTRPNAAQKRWMADVMQWAKINGPVAQEVWFNGDMQCHHCAGRSYKHNKVQIGNYFILPLDIVLHDVHSSNDYNVTHWRKRFTERFGNQRDLWMGMVDSMREQGYEIPFGQDVIDSVMDTRY